ncbi:MAG TPA: ATP-binding protein [Methylomirabilota bacterium]
MSEVERDRRFMSLETKLLWGTLFVIALVMATVIVLVEHRLRAAIIDEVERRGEVLARNLAAMSHTPILLYNFTALEQNVARVAAEPDVRYAIVLDADGKVAAHSRHPEQVGLVLPGAVADRAAGTQSTLTQEVPAASGRPASYDFAVPVMVNGQKWGTARVGLSKRAMEAEIRQTRWELAGLTVIVLLLGGGAAAVVARNIARPVRRLAAGAAAISRGELRQRIEVTSADEIGELAGAFNHMTAQLLQERTALEHAHAQLRRRYEELVDLKGYTDNILGSLTAGVVTADLEGRVVTLNPAAELLTGFFAGEVVGRYCTDVFAPTPALGELLMQTLSTRVPSGEIQLTLRRRMGRSVPIEFSAAPLNGGEGKDLGVVGVIRDLSVVRELESQLQRSDQLAALGTLAAGLAHEIKNPLTSVLLFTRRLYRSFGDEQFQEKFLSVVPRELERINAIVEQLLELARPAPPQFRSVPLAPLLDRVVELHANEIDAKQIRVYREYASGLPPVHGDGEYLYQVFVNLVANAIDALPRGGCLMLRLSREQRADARVLVLRPHPATRPVAVEIEDNGVGIAAADASRIFDPFFTTKEKGTGLGLAITHKIVEGHGGTITFKSAPGEGTTFRVTLPVAMPGLPGELRS